MTEDIPEKKWWKEVLKSRWKAWSMIPVIFVFAIIEYQHFSTIYNLYWNSQLHIVLLSFAGVVLGLLFVAMSILYTFVSREGNNTYLGKSINSVWSFLNQTALISALNVLSYFLRYDVYGKLVVFVELLALPVFFISLIYVIAIPSRTLSDMSTLSNSAAASRMASMKSFIGSFFSEIFNPWSMASKNFP